MRRNRWNLPTEPSIDSWKKTHSCDNDWSARDAISTTPCPQPVAAELQSLLTDSLSDLKLLGIALAESFVTTQAEIPEGLTQAMADTVADTDPQVRRAAAGLQGLLDDEAAVALLETRLATERASDVRVGLLNALGRQRAVSSFKAVLARVSAKHKDRKSVE